MKTKTTRPSSAGVVSSADYQVLDSYNLSPIVKDKIINIWRNYYTRKESSYHVEEVQKKTYTNLISWGFFTFIMLNWIFPNDVSVPYWVIILTVVTTWFGSVSMLYMSLHCYFNSFFKKISDSRTGANARVYQSYKSKHGGNEVYLKASLVSPFSLRVWNQKTNISFKSIIGVIRPIFTALFLWHLDYVATAIVFFVFRFCMEYSMQKLRYAVARELEELEA